MNEVDKLRVLIPHWMEHNQEHAQEFRDWAPKVSEIEQDILAAAAAIVQANDHLQSALDKLGGPSDVQG